MLVPVNKYSDILFLADVGCDVRIQGLPVRSRARVLVFECHVSPEHRGQHSGYSNFSIHTLHTAEILQQANGGREEEARATTLCMAWHAQQETSSCATIPTDTGRRGYPASTTSVAAGGVAIRVQYNQGQTVKAR